MQQFYGQKLRIDISSPGMVKKNLMLYGVTEIHKHDFVILIRSRGKTQEESYDSLLTRMVVDEDVNDLRADGYLAFERGNYAKASEYLEKAALKSNNSEVQFYAAVSFEAINCIHKACYWYEKSANSGNESAKVYLPQIFF
ncbi:MAG: hypothetical protein K5685_14710 [Bacteroidales bacterium]|nr:hypothetical protein [Bacteroidales bacterium]